MGKVVKILAIVLFLIFMSFIFRGCGYLIDHSKYNKIISHFESNDKSTFESSLFKEATFKSNFFKYYPGKDKEKQVICSQSLAEFQYVSNHEKEYVCVRVNMVKNTDEFEKLKDIIQEVHVSANLDFFTTEQGMELFRYLLLSLNKNVTRPEISNYSTTFSNKVSEAGCSEVSLSLGHGAYFKKKHDWNCKPSYSFEIKVLQKDLVDKAKEYYKALRNKEEDTIWSRL